MLVSCKLNAYGISYEACNITRSYYINAYKELNSLPQEAVCKACEKGDHKDQYLAILFNIFINDIT